jgi:hypothetical protein
MKWVFDDGGRAAAGYKGSASGDCAVRAIAIAMQRPYADVYAELADVSRYERPSKRRRGHSHPRTGMHRVTIRDYLETNGWTWTPTMKIGTGCRVHLRKHELPTGRLVVAVSRHYTAVVDGVIRDSFDPSRGGTRCVYGYFRRGQ